MMVVDSSVWIGQMRRSGSYAVEKLRAVPNPTATILVGDLVLLEVLQGARDDRHAREIETELRVFRMDRMLDIGIAAKTARNYRVLRGRGITLQGTTDLVIATFCVEHGHSLLHDDRDFDAMAPHIGLTVV
jgi:predicted nucleic acid-binding protein